MDMKGFLAWLDITNNVNIQMPNEIFEDFEKLEFKNFNHKCFSYAYYYLNTYIYRNALYGNHNTEEYGMQGIASKLFSSITKVSYIFKKDGILDKSGYTSTTTNYPTSYYFEDDALHFSLIKDFRMENKYYKLNHSPRFSIKVPNKAFVRFEDGEDFTGTFYDFSNTHTLDVVKVAKILTDDKLGHVGLYLYGYLKMMCDKFPYGYQISNLSLAQAVGCTERTIIKYTKRLEEVGLISSDRKLLGYKLLEKRYVLL